MDGHMAPQQVAAGEDYVASGTHMAAVVDGMVAQVSGQRALRLIGLCTVSTGEHGLGLRDDGGLLRCLQRLRMW